MTKWFNIRAGKDNGEDEQKKKYPTGSTCVATILYNNSLHVDSM